MMFLLFKHCTWRWKKSDFTFLTIPYRHSSIQLLKNRSRIEIPKLWLQLSWPLCTCDPKFPSIPIPIQRRLTCMESSVNRSRVHVITQREVGARNIENFADDNACQTYCQNSGWRTIIKAMSQLKSSPLPAKADELALLSKEKIYSLLFYIFWKLFLPSCILYLEMNVIGFACCFFCNKSTSE